MTFLVRRLTLCLDCLPPMHRKKARLKLQACSRNIEAEALDRVECY